MMTLPVPLQSNWRVGDRDKEAEAVLCAELKVNSLVAGVLVQRGYKDPEAANRFLHPDLDHLTSPTLLPDFQAAADAILAARDLGETIYIHGDYDVDGVTSAALFGRFLELIKCKVVVHVPHRMKEGYGIHLSAVEAAHEAGAKLFVTCDCGTSAIEQVNRARELGMKVVVTDHHELGSTLPDALAVVNPHRPEYAGHFGEICGAAVVLKVCAGIAEQLGMPVKQFYRAYLDLAALGTIADVMPLVDENRVIAKLGLEQLGASKKVGIRALLEVAEIPQKVDAHHVGFQLGPRLNATGRIDDAARALSLLLERDVRAAQETAKALDELNRERQDAQRRIVEEALEMVVEQGLCNDHVIVVAGETWHPGIVGIVASRILETFYRPTFVFTQSEDGTKLKGSARSIDAFHVKNAMDEVAHVLETYGGHAKAAGATLKIENLIPFRTGINEVAAGLLSPDDLLPVFKADFEVGCEEVIGRSVEELELLKPFGNGNPRPRFMAKDLDVVSLKSTKNEDHVIVKLQPQDSASFDSIAFGMGKRFAEIQPNTMVDILFEPEIDSFNGSKRVKWSMRDFHATS